MKIFLILCLFVYLSIQIPSFNLVYLPKTNGAICMDGTQAGIYIFDPDQ
jgi:hypothetical protein